MAKKKISAKPILSDINAGVSDISLIEKYELSEKELQVVFRKLLEKNLLTQAELDARSHGSEPESSLTSAPYEDVPSKSEAVVVGDNKIQVGSGTGQIDENPPLDAALESEEERYEKNKLPLLGRLIFAIICMAGLVTVSVLYLNIHYRFEFPIPNWIPIKKTQPMQVKDDPPSVLLSSKSTPGPCDEKEPPYPVLRIQRDASAKQVLKTMIELSVFLRDVTPHQYYEALRYFIRSEPPEIRLIYKDFFSDECGCRMDPDDMEMMKYIVNDIVNERLVSTFKPAGNLTTANGNDGEATEELEKRSQWLKGKPFMERLQLIKKDTLSCNRAVKELLAFVNSTVDKAIKDCLEYEAIMADRNAGINDCRQKAKDAAERKALN